ncbi:Alpha-1,3-mannosyltransferase CMT1 [Colletotrichum orbiculare MAFF 240422]|uniref:Alpha-1,3-mannosyltransferase CMT1 n=1 Tax=Colletotrichum orbiculare (strain 104-T / ATCC 96160 / CBS 514.97 / LARS 414 / MAFF 240422) TaxID=1213857 RepID=N4VEF7_COLOR|nr:Alpha-1,3-mannosyltransferase CMT1 [Colletotrichum orbiculare MAFF 240422]
MIANFHQPRRLKTPFIAAAVFISITGFFLFFRRPLVQYFVAPWTSQQYGGSWMNSTKPNWSQPSLGQGMPGKTECASRHVQAILDPKNGDIPIVNCPALNTTRYGVLKPTQNLGRRHFFFALDLRQVVDLLPQLIGSVLEAVNFLGPENCALSIVEGISTDGTYETLYRLRGHLDRMGVAYHLQTSNIDSHSGDRIGKLAKLRNLALEPMMAEAEAYDRRATVVFLNDVAACTEDILELAYQKQAQGADMTCAMDYHFLRWAPHNGEPSFYDSWISRGINGDTFLPVPDRTPKGEQWSDVANMFWNAPGSQNRYLDRKPLQVFACWNGAVAVTGEPFLRRELDFRRSYRGECHTGEPTLLCKDLWNLGHGKIAVVPSVSLAYNVNDGRQIKEERGFVSTWVATEHKGPPVQISWQLQPPEMVKCMPTFRKQFWRPWNEGLKTNEGS